MSHRKDYFNPFSATHAEEAVDDTMRITSAPDIYLTSKPEHLFILDHDCTELSIAGQGTVAVRAVEAAALLFTFGNKDHTGLALTFSVDGTDCAFSLIDTLGGEVKLPGVLLQSPASSVVHPGITETYWVSLDRKNGALRYGKKYLNAGLTLYEVNLKHMSGDGVPEWNDETYASFDNLTHVTVTQVGGDIGALRLVTLPLPVVVDLPPYVVTHDTLTLDELASGVVTVPDNLPLECQKLYYNVAGPNIVLDTPDFPDFSAAIERSIHTPGLIGYELLKKKANHFGKEDFAGTYLRITLGRDLGDSPGPPYVLEIWPSGHYSPIHDHGNSYAVIRVLHGKIQAFYYDSLELPPRQLGPPALLKKGDVTWISDKSYQVHQLVNPPEYGSLCCTIQCYQYGSQDKKHYEFFDYLADTDGDHKPDVKKPFTPNSDMAFTLFKQKIKAEWERRIL